jgi:hypothetical protein
MTDRNPLAPLERIIALIGGLMLLGLLVVVPASLVGSESGIWGLGRSDVCVTAPSGALVSQSGGRQNLTGAHVRTAESGVDARASEFELCTFDPSTRQQLLSTLSTLPEFLFAFGFVVITWRLTRRVRRRGLFMPEVARTLGRLAVYLFVGEFAVVGLQGLATQRLVSTMVTEHTNYLGGYYNLSWAVIIAAFGLQAMSRVMAMAVPMREEIDATV